jgi:hypothetical protein
MIQWLFLEYAQDTLTLDILGGSDLSFRSRCNLEESGAVPRIRSAQNGSCSGGG